MTKQKVRKVTPKNCANCAHRVMVDDYPECEFDSSIPIDHEEMHYLVCNWFEASTPNKKTNKKKVIYI